MRAIVPVIGHELFAAIPSLKERVEDLILDLGLEYFWVTVGNIRELHNADPCTTEIPMIIITHAERRLLEEFADIYYPLLNKYPSAQILKCTFDRVPQEIFRNGLNVSLWRKNISSEIVKNAIRDIYKNLSLPELSIKKVAQDIHVSYSTLERNFKYELGKSAYSYIIEKRIEEANRMLAYTDLPVYSVAHAVGYIDLPSFDRIYKKKMRVTPLQFRKAIPLSEKVKSLMDKAKSLLQIAYLSIIVSL